MVKNIDKSKIDKKSKTDIMREVGPFINFGWQLVITVGLCTLLGWWLDTKFETAPILLIIFAFFGAFAGLYSFLRAIINISNKNKKR